MRNMKLPIAALASVCLLLAGCGGSNSTKTSTQPSVTGLAITPATTSLADGLTLQLAAMATSSSGSPTNVTNSASWSSSNPSVLTVSATGLVTTLSTGSATIGVLYGSVNQTVAFTVTNPIVNSIVVTAAASSVAVGSTDQLTATATLTNGATQALSLPTWQSSNTAIATVSASGVVTGVSTGTVTITATDTTTNISGTFQVTVTPPVLASITVTGAGSSLYVGGTLQLTATGTFSDGSTNNLTSTAAWTSLTPAVATVTGGLVTGVSAGTASITATASGITGSLTVTVAAAGAILVNPTQGQLQLGSTLQFSAQTNSGDVTQQATWTSSDPATLTVVSGGPLSGLVTARAVGSATVTATLGTNQTPVTVTVAAAPTTRFAITANPADSTLSVYTVNNTSGSLTPFTYSALPNTLVNPVNVLVDPAGQFAYVAVNGGVGVLSITSVTSASTLLGTLTPLTGGFYATANAPTGMSFDPSGAHLYVADGSQIFAFAVNSGSGALTPVAGSPFANAGASNVVEVDPLGRYLYSSIGSSGAIAAFSIGAGGALQPLVQPTFTAGTTPQGIAFDASGLYLFVANSGDGTIGSYTIDPGSGNLAPAGSPITVGTQPVSLAASPVGLVYFVDAAADKVGSATVDLATGVLSANSTTPATIGSGSEIAFDPAYNFLYTAEPATATPATTQAETFSLDTNGNPVWASVAGTRGNAGAIAFVPGDQTIFGPDFLYSLIGDTGNLVFSVSPANGTLSNPVSVDGGR